jgi:hypothetical protein
MTCAKPLAARDWPPVPPSLLADGADCDLVAPNRAHLIHGDGRVAIGAWMNTSVMFPLLACLPVCSGCLDQLVCCLADHWGPALENDFDWQTLLPGFWRFPTSTQQATGACI